MSSTRYLFQMADGMPVVIPPSEIDMTTAGRLRAILFEWHRRGFTTVVVDMIGTQGCDSAGVRELVWAHKRRAVTFLTLTGASTAPVPAVSVDP